MKKELKNEKITLDEYIKKYTKKETSKNVKSLLAIAITLIFVILIASLGSLCLKLFEINKIVGYIGLGISVLIIILCFIIPTIKILKHKAFQTNVNYSNVKESKAYNERMREELADKIIELYGTTEDAFWYDEKHIFELAKARNNKDREALKEALTVIYNDDVKKQANKLIRDCALKVGSSTAISQSEVIDTAVSVTFNMDLIKKIIYLYGFRPTDSEMTKIYFGVITSAMTSYSAQSFGGKVSSAIGNSISGVPIVGMLISTAIDSTSQFLLNSLLTVLIGNKTKKYLLNDYHLQDILDTIELTDDDEELAKEVKEEILKVKSKK